MLDLDQVQMEDIERQPLMDASSKSLNQAKVVPVGDDRRGMGKLSLKEEPPEDIQVIALPHDESGIALMSGIEIPSCGVGRLILEFDNDVCVRFDIEDDDEDHENSDEQHAEPESEHKLPPLAPPAEPPPPRLRAGGVPRQPQFIKDITPPNSPRFPVSLL